jgi:hypothetical protein
MSLKQGELKLLQTDVAVRLLASGIPARVSYIALDGTPRVVAAWFHWTGEVLSMPTFLAAPHVRHPPGRLRALRANPSVAVMIDTETFPPEVLTIRGRVEIIEVEGVAPDTRRRPGATSVRKGRGNTWIRSISREREWPVSIFAPPGSACSTSRRDFQSALGGIA